LVSVDDLGSADFDVESFGWPPPHDTTMNAAMGKTDNKNFFIKFSFRLKIDLEFLKES
jgi:hypothetical protein